MNSWFTMYFAVFHCWFTVGSLLVHCWFTMVLQHFADADRDCARGPVGPARHVGPVTPATPVGPVRPATPV